MDVANRLGLAFGLLSALACLGGSARADVLALDYTGGTPGNVGLPPDTLGWEFNLSQPISVTSLGFFDVGSDGLAESHQVALWTSGGTLLASATVTSASTPIGSTSSLGDWLFEAIAPVALGQGTYVIGAYYPSRADLVVGADASLITAPGVNWTATRFGDGAGFAFPGKSTTGTVGDFGPDFQFQAVPEPASLLLLGLGVAGLAVCVSRRGCCRHAVEQ